MSVTDVLLDQGGAVFNVLAYPHTPANDQTSITDAIGHADDFGGIVYFPQRSTPYAVTASIDIPANVALQFAEGAQLSIGAGLTVTVRGVLQAGPWQIFAGDFALTGTWSVTANGTTVTGSGTQATTQLQVGQKIRFAREYKEYTITGIASDTSITIASPGYDGLNASGLTAVRVAGTVDLRSGLTPFGYPEWWGVTGSGGGDYPALLKAAASLPHIRFVADQVYSCPDQGVTIPLVSQTTVEAYGATLDNLCLYVQPGVTDVRILGGRFRSTSTSNQLDNPITLYGQRLLVRDVIMEGVKWGTGIQLVYTARDVHIENADIDFYSGGAAGDLIVIEGKRVTVTGCRLSGYDDGIVLKAPSTGLGNATEEVAISACTVRNCGTGVAVGTEVATGQYVRNVSVSALTCYQVAEPVMLKVGKIAGYEGGVLENVQISGVAAYDDGNWTESLYLARVTLGGTWSVTQGSTAVTGSGTSATTTLAPGYRITFDNGLTFYVVAGVSSDTSIVLASAYAGSTASGLTGIKQGDVLNGSFTVVNGSTTVTGTGTAALSQLGPGYRVRFGADLATSVVASVASDTSLTLLNPYTGTSGTKNGLRFGSTGRMRAPVWIRTDRECLIRDVQVSGVQAFGRCTDNSPPYGVLIQADGTDDRTVGKIRPATVTEVRVSDVQVIDPLGGVAGAFGTPGDPFQNAVVVQEVSGGIVSAVELDAVKVSGVEEDGVIVDTVSGNEVTVGRLVEKDCCRGGTTYAAVKVTAGSKLVKNGAWTVTPYGSAKPATVGSGGTLIAEEVTVPIGNVAAGQSATVFHLLRCPKGRKMWVMEALAVTTTTVANDNVNYVTFYIGKAGASNFLVANTQLGGVTLTADVPGRIASEYPTDVNSFFAEGEMLQLKTTPAGSSPALNGLRIIIRYVLY